MTGRRLAGAMLALAITACAKMEPPPGGPTDRVPPGLIATIPDSLAVLPDFSGDVEFLFNETVSEGGSPNMGLGTGDLEKLVILSPSERVPKVRWKRSRVTVRPAEGWQPNTVYRVQLLPGVMDLQRNRYDSTRVVTLTTGAPLPDPAPDRTGLGLGDGAPRPPGAGRRRPAARQPAVPDDRRQRGEVRLRAAAVRRLSRLWRHRPEQERTARPPRSVGLRADAAGQQRRCRSCGCSRTTRSDRGSRRRR